MAAITHLGSDAIYKTCSKRKSTFVQLCFIEAFQVVQNLSGNFSKCLLKTQRKKSGKWNKSQEVKDKNGSLKAFHKTQEALKPDRRISTSSDSDSIDSVHVSEHDSNRHEKNQTLSPKPCLTHKKERHLIPPPTHTHTLNSVQTR